MVIITSNNFIYVLAFKSKGTDEAKIYKVDENLEVVAEYNFIGKNSSDLQYLYDILDIKKVGLSLLSIADNKIYILLKNSIEEMTLDLSLVQTIDISNDSNKILSNYFYEIYRLKTQISKDEKDAIYYYSYDRKDNYEVFAGDINICSTLDYTYVCPIEGFSGYIQVTKDGKKLWDIKLSKYNSISSAIFKEDYIIATAINTPEYWEDFQSTFLIFDLEGNLVRSIKGTATAYYRLVSTPVGFILTNITSSFCRVSYGLDDIMEYSHYCALDTQVNVYNLPFNIETKITGKGEVNVLPKAKSQEKADVEVIPEKDYVLGDVKVTDKDGNILTFTSNKITMPSSDVIIEVTFKKEILNPETKDTAIFSIAFTFIIGTISTILNYKKLRWLK